MPDIAGFTSHEPSLADEWKELSQFETAQLVPDQAMAHIHRYPTGWLTVEQHIKVDYDSDGVSAVLISPEAREAAFNEHEWIGEGLGEFSLFGEDEIELGLFEKLGNGSVEFFVQIQRNHGTRPINVEISHPFLWFWDAMRDGNQWSYLDSAGIEHPLVRTNIDGKNYTVEVRALEFRRYIGQRNMLGLIQHEHVRWATPSKQIKLHQVHHESEWAKFTWHASDELSIPGKTALSRLLGKSLVTGVDGKPNPSWLDYDAVDYPEFVIRVDAKTGLNVSFSADPDKLANYFGKNPDAPHYLTPVHFDAKVLNRYLDEPDRYSVSPTRISGVDMWSISIGRTSTGDVEAYLGDIGRDLPWQELDHWRAHNIPPRGQMSEDKFRRDFLGQWAGSVEPLEALREAYKKANDAARHALGWPIFRPLTGGDLVDFERLQPPTLAAQRHLLRPVLILAKTLVDAINSKAIKKLIGPSDLRSISLLEALLEHIGGNPTVVTPLRDLYRLRSSGGLAHLADESREKVYVDIGILGMTPAQATDLLASRLAEALGEIAEQLTTFGKSSVRPQHG